MTTDTARQATLPTPILTPDFPQAAAAAQTVPVAQRVQLPGGVTSASPWLRLGSYFLESVLLTVTLGIGWMIWAATTAGTGQTPAKRLLGLRVIGADTMRPVGFGKMFWVRGVLAPFVAGFAILFTVGVLLFMPFWDKRRQNIWDKVSSCYVVSDPNDAWGCKPDLR